MKIKKALKKTAIGIILSLTTGAAMAQSALSQLKLQAGDDAAALTEPITPPAGAPAPRTLPALDAVAIYSFHPGYSARPIAVELAIKQDGTAVYKTNDLRGGKTAVRDIGKLAAERLPTLRTAIELIRAEDLKDPNAGGPSCADAPSTYYQVVKKNGRPVTIASWVNCHNSAMESSPQAQAVKRLLDGLLALAQLP